MSELRSELEGAADDITRLTEQLIEWGQVVERLETLVGHVLTMLPAAVIVVDDAGRVMAASRGALEGHPEISKDILGKPVSVPLSADIASGILNVARTGGPAPGTGPRGDGSGEWTAPWVTVADAQVTALPGGWALAVLSLD